jgi:hypothetical protein
MRLAIVVGAMVLGLIGEVFDAGWLNNGGATTTSGASSQEEQVHAMDDTFPPPSW